MQWLRLRRGVAISRQLDLHQLVTYSTQSHFKMVVMAIHARLVN